MGAFTRKKTCQKPRFLIKRSGETKPIPLGSTLFSIIHFAMQLVSSEKDKNDHEKVNQNFNKAIVQSATKMGIR